MSNKDPAPPSGQPSEPAVKQPVRCNWRRVRLYGWAVLLMLALWTLGGAITLRVEPKRFIDQAFAKFPFPSSVGDARWLDAETLQLRYVKLGDFFYADSITLTASVRDLLNHHIRAVTLSGADLFMSNLNKLLSQSKTQRTKDLDWTMRQLVIRRSLVMLDFGPQLPPIPVNVGERRDVILHHVHLGTPDSSLPMTEERVVELENIHFASPFDPLAPVLSLPLVRIKFSYADIWRHKIREIDLVRPRLYLGQDLFWFTDQMKKSRSSATAAGPEAPWKVSHFGIQYGQLAVNTFGQPRLNFPFFFDTQADDIQIDQLDKLTAKNVIAIRHFSKNYPEYKIHVTNLYGKLEFSVPPTDAKANNIVPTLFIDEISWNDIPVTKAWVSSTFDPTGIYARMGGTCEKGQMEGNFEVYYTKGFAWNGGFFAHQIDCAPIAEKLAGKYGTLTGVINGKISVQGQGTDIQRCDGALSLDRPGALTIQSVDRLVNDLPASMVGVRRQALQLGLQAFSYYPYTTGQFLVDYAPGNGSATLKLDGPRGRRDFSVYWHPFESSEVAKAGDTH